MSRLFASLYLDEDVDVLVGKLIRARGFEVVSVQEVRRFGMTDEAQLGYASEIESALLTHNRVDFEKLAEAWRIAGRMHHGIIVAAWRRPHILAGRLFQILNQFTSDEMANRVLYV